MGQLNAFFDIQRLRLCPCLLTHPLSSCNFRDKASPTVCLPTQDTKSEVGIQVSRPLYGGSNNLQPTTMSQDSNLDLDTSLSQLVLQRGVLSTYSNLFSGRPTPPPPPPSLSPYSSEQRSSRATPATPPKAAKRGVASGGAGTRRDHPRSRSPNGGGNQIRQEAMKLAKFSCDTLYRYKNLTLDELDEEVHTSVMKEYFAI
ncbi:hypothetical protein B0H13DRAFT_1853142 [Mycena leptocephala]|nr:hypothetical protein B0H13DRAFT_1853142 [Mycena leptocephala]